MYIFVQFPSINIMLMECKVTPAARFKFHVWSAIFSSTRQE